MKVGDKVRYLNAVGGGIITKIGDKGIITVLEEDGFETPTLAREVVVVAQTNDLNFVEKNSDNHSADITPTKPNISTPKRYEFDDIEETPEGEKINISLAFVPQDIKNLQTSSIECFLINESNYYINFQLLDGKNDTKCHTADIIEPQTRLLICTIAKEDVNSYEFLTFQGFAFKKDKSFCPKKAIDISLKINPVNFYKLHQFATNDFFDKKAMIIDILYNDYPPIKNFIDDKKIEMAMQQKKSYPQKKEFIKPNKNEIIEIDLHIHQLTEHTNNLTNRDMLNIQMERFKTIMEENAKKRGQKIVFIHGKGEGVLRKEIETQLKKNYPKARYQDASFQKYGFGATMVIIH